jgi:hypothetical protein
MGITGNLFNTLFENYLVDREQTVVGLLGMSALQQEFNNGLS